jgi:hypothetical protein
VVKENEFPKRKGILIRETIHVPEGGLRIDLANIFKPKKGERVERVEVPEVRRWIGWAGIKQDLQFVIGACNEYIQGHEKDASVTRRCLWIGAVITYAKCFNEGEGRRARLDYKRTLANKVELHSVHHRTMDARNKFLAHAGNTEHEKTFLYALKAPSPDESIRDLGINLFSTHTPKNNELSLIKELALENLNWVDAKLQDAKSQVKEWAKAHNASLPKSRETR